MTSLLLLNAKYNPAEKKLPEKYEPLNVAVTSVGVFILTMIICAVLLLLWFVIFDLSVFYAQ